jgi:hypothetical protein
MSPPFAHDPTVIDKDLPIRIWKHARSSDSAEVCERTRSALLALARNKVVEAADVPQKERAKVLLKYATIYASRCVASDDPRADKAPFPHPEEAGQTLQCS